MPHANAANTKGSRTRRTIEEEARKTLICEGYTGLTLRGLAGRLGMALGNLQYYFPSKDDLVEAVITRETETALAPFKDLSFDSQSPDQVIQSAVTTLLERHASNAGKLYTIAEHLALHSPRFADLKKNGYSYVFDAVNSLLPELTPGLTAEQRARLARILIALIDGASLQVQLAANTPASAREFHADTADTIMHLINSWRP